MSNIILQCIKEGGKLRIKFHSYNDISGNTYTNVYDNTLNCQFPKNIREVGLFYEIIPESLTIQEKNGARPFYKINRANIKIVQPVIDTSNLKIFLYSHGLSYKTVLPHFFLVLLKLLVLFHKIAQIGRAHV